MDNVMTKALEKTVAMMVKVNDKLGEMGKMPYGQRKATPAERKIQKELAQQVELQELLHG
jgi:hypothetical protein